MPVFCQGRIEYVGLDVFDTDKEACGSVFFQAESDIDAVRAAGLDVHDSDRKDLIRFLSEYTC